MKEHREKSLISIVNSTSIKTAVNICLTFHSKLPIMNYLLLETAPQANLSKW